MDTSDAAVLDQWVSMRDAEAFRVLSVRYSGMVYGTCRRMLGDPKEAEDVAQECFEALCSTKKAPGDYLGPWLHRVATYKCLKRLRSEGRRQRREREFLERQAPESGFVWDDLHEFVDEAIADLPEGYRELVIAHFIENQSHAAIAESLGLSRPAVTLRLGKAIESIRESLRRKGIPVAVSALGAMLGAHLKAEAAPATLGAALGKLALAGPAVPAAAFLAGWASLVKLAALALVLTVGVGGIVFYETRRDTSPSGAINEPRKSEPDISQFAAPAAARETPVASPAVSTPVAIEESVSPAAGMACVEGVLRTPQGAPLPDYCVEAIPLGVEEAEFKSSTTWTMDQGAFSINDLKPGRYFVYSWESRKPTERLFPATTQNTVVTLAADEKKTGVLLVLNEGLTISGRVLDVSGKPIPGAEVLGSPDLQYRYTHPHPLAAEMPMKYPSDFSFNHNVDASTDSTDSQGRFRLIALSDTDYEVAFGLKGYRQVNQTLPAGTKDLEVVLERLGKITVSGRVVDLDTQEPLSSFEVGYSRAYDTLWGSMEGVAFDRSGADAEGRFIFEIPEGAEGGYLVARAPGYFQNVENLREWWDGRDDRVENVTLGLPKSRAVRGQVVDEDERPVKEAFLYIGPPPSAEWSTIERDALASTGEDGRFEVQLPAKREMLISATSREYDANRPKYVGDSAVLPATDGDVDDVVLRLSRTGASVRGMAAYLGQPIQTRLDVTAQGTACFIGRTWIGSADETGAYTVAQLPPLAEAEVCMSTGISPGFGPYVPPSGVAYNWIRARRSISVGRNGETQADLDFVEGDAQVHGVVRIEGAQAVPDRALFLEIDRANGVTQTYNLGLDENGEFIAAGLPAGEGRLAVHGVTTDGQYAGWETPLSLHEGESLELPCNFTRENVKPQEKGPAPF